MNRKNASKAMNITRQLWKVVCLGCLLGLPAQLSAGATAGLDAADESARLHQRAYDPSTMEVLEQDDVVRLARDRETDLLYLYYHWAAPAVVYEVNALPGQIVHPGRQLTVLSVKTVGGTPPRSKAHIEAGASYRVEAVNIQVGQQVGREPGEAPLFVFSRTLIPHDSAVQRESRGLYLAELLEELWQSTGIREIIVQTSNDWTLGIGRLLMIAVGLILLALAIFKKFEPLLLVPIGFGCIMTNVPIANLSGPDGVLGMLSGFGIDTGLFPLLIFMGVGAMTDFGPLIANPKTALLGAAAQVGIFSALLGAPLLFVNWRPAGRLNLRGFYFPIHTVFLGGEYELGGGWKLFSSYRWENDRYYRYGREKREQRLFWYEQRLETGIAWSTGSGIELALSGGYAWDRFFFEGKSYGDNRTDNRLDISDGPFLTARFRARF